MENYLKGTLPAWISVCTETRTSATRRVVRFVSVLVAMAVVLGSAVLAHADTVTAMWDANTESNIGGYVLSYGTQSGTYTTTQDVGNVTSYQFELSPGRYYFTVQAYSTDGQMSPRSTEVMADIGTGSGPSIMSLSPTSGTVGTAVTISGSGFGSTQGSSSVRFNGTAAAPTAWSGSTITMPVPNGATTGPVVVTVDGVSSNGMTFTVTMPANQAPTLTQPANQTTTQGMAGSLQLSASDPEGSTITYSASGLPTGLSVNASSGLISGTVTASASTYTVTATASDGSLTNSKSFTWTVNAANRAPDLTQPANQTTTQGTAASLQLSASDPDGNTITYSASGLPTGLSVNASSGLISGTVTASASTYSVTATASDGSLTNSKSFTWTVNAANRAPVLTQPANQTSAEGSSVSLQLSASDPDGNAITYSATGLPAGLSVNASSGAISGTLTYTSAGTYSVTASASDGSLSDSKTFTWTVSDVSQAPVITSLSPTSGAAGTSVTISGSNFGASQSSSTVTFNGAAATAASWSSTSIVATVPSGAMTGAVVVTVGGVASNGVTFTVTSTALPSPWQTQDIGSPALAGSASFASDTFTVAGAGTDIGGTADQFRIVYQTLDGNGEVRARVAGLDAADAGAKAGVMIREDLAANSPHVAAQVTAGAGLTFQSRGSRGGTTSTSSAAGTAPQWVRVVRSGVLLTGYYSVNGASWTSMGTVLVPMATRVYVGLTVTGHNAAARATATFTNVTVSRASLLSLTKTLVSAELPTEAQATDAAQAQAAARRPAVASDYDGDGRSDVVAAGAAAGTASILTSSSGFTAAISKVTGASTDLAVPGDYDGDGKTDIATYRPSTGTWAVLTSSSDFTTSRDLVLGTDGDVPVPGDYDGNGTTDAAIYSPATGQWHIVGAGAQTPETLSLWGTVKGVAVPGDYDGDGKTDPAVFTAATGEWKILRSTSGFVADATMVLGKSGDVAMPADYDGDGITDLAVYSPSTGTWQARLSANGAQPVIIARHGMKADVPATGDYDGDGRADLAVLHAGTWQVLYSSTGYTSGVAVAAGRSALAQRQ